MRVPTIVLAAALLFGLGARPAGAAWPDVHAPNPTFASGNATQVVGEIKHFAGSFGPLHWAPCNGADLSVVYNTPLFAVIGAAFGGTGDGYGWSDTFKLPALPGGTETSPAQPLPLICVDGAYPNESFQGDDYVGLIRLSHKRTHPPGWVACQGQTIAGAQTTQLAPLLGGQAGDPVTLPDLPDQLDGRLGWYIAVRGEPGLPGVLGDVRRWPAAAPVPSGWVPCDGRTFQVFTDSALFSLLATRYGGDGYRTFAAPKLADEGGARWLLCVAGEFPGR